MVNQDFLCYDRSKPDDAEYGMLVRIYEAWKKAREDAARTDASVFIDPRGSQSVTKSNC